MNGEIGIMTIWQAGQKFTRSCTLKEAKNAVDGQSVVASWESKQTPKIRLY